MVIGIWIPGPATKRPFGSLFDLFTESGLARVPMSLFEIIDRRASRHWVIKVEDSGSIYIGPPSIADSPYYHDDLSNRDEGTMADFDRVLDALRSEDAEPA